MMNNTLQILTDIPFKVLAFIAKREVSREDIDSINIVLKLLLLLEFILIICGLFLNGVRLLIHWFTVYDYVEIMKLIVQ